MHALRLFFTGLCIIFACGSAASIAAAADFGTPPSGEVPVLFNDHTVYAKPDTLHRSRVLAAFFKDGAIYVPLRSMFEQMGASVTASADGTTFTATKSGASVSVTLGSALVTINGETRPLDVAPMRYHGVVLVPIRVLSEALGAYVQWVADRHVVVVRYVEPPAIATPAPVITASPAPVPLPSAAAPIVTAAPTAAPTERPYTVFIQGALSKAKNYNEFSAGQYCDSLLLSGAFVFKDAPLAVKVDYRRDTYVTSDALTDSIGNHYTQFATIDGGTAFTPVFRAKQTSLDVRLEFQVAAPHVLVGIAYLHADNNYGYPQLNAIGFGIEKLPDLRPGIGFYGSAFYYPSAGGSYTVPFPASINYTKSYDQHYALLKYDIGATLAFKHVPAYLFGGFGGDRYYVKQNAPIGQIHAGPYLGLGVKI